MTEKEKIRFAIALAISLFSLGFAVYFLRIGISLIGVELGGAKNGLEFAAQIVMELGRLLVQFIGVAAMCGLLLGAFLAHSLKHHPQRKIAALCRVMFVTDAVFAAAVILTDALMIPF